MRMYLLLFAITMAALSSRPATAQVIDPYSTDYFTKIRWDDINSRTSAQAREAKRKGTKSTPQRTTTRTATPKQSTTRKTASTAASRVTPASAAALNFRPTSALAQSKGINVMVAQYKGDQQAVMRTNFVAMINTFNDSVPRLYSVQKNNLATGAATLLSGAYVAYYNRSFPDAWVKPLVQQLKSTMADNSSLTSASAVDKETAYHVMVGTGMVLQVTQAELAKTPDARKVAELKKAGAQVFRAMGITDPDRIQFSQSGISLR